MSDIFGGIFDNFGSLFDDFDVMGAVGKAGKAIMSSGSSGGGADGITDMSDLTRKLMEQSLGRNFNSTKTGAVESVNPEGLEKAWYARLMKFAEVEANSGVKLK